MNIDDALVPLGLGRYQFTGCLLFGLVIMYSNVSLVAYVFTASDLQYRCEIPECDVPNVTERMYNPDWLRFTTPFRDDTELPRKCLRYAVRTEPDNQTRCVPSNFDKDTTERCHGSWVFEDPEKTIGTEFDLMCEHNKWKLSTVGSVNSLGQFIGIPMSGIIADKYGRKFTMIFCTTVSAMVSIVQSFSINYSMYLVLELLSSTISSGIYTVTFVLAIEMILPKKRVLFYSILEYFYPFGAVLVALIASQVKDWRMLLRITNIPGLLFITYIWLTDESIRWLEMQGKRDRAINVLKKMAGVNKKTLPDVYLNAGIMSPSNGNYNDGANYGGNILKDVFRSRTILLRVIKSSAIWMATTLVYYGLSINAVNLAGNKYLNFIFVSVVEIPGCLLNWAIMECVSRKTSLSCMFLLSGATSVAYNLTPNDFYWMKLCVFMVSKLTITAAFNILYMLTAEIFPTQMRATLLAVCSMIGRIGSILAPQTTLLAEYYGEFVTMLVFGATSIMAAAITMTLPETKNVKLSDTIDEAEKIGV